MEINVYGLVNDSIVDGPGLRYTIFVQGCPHACEGCHNPESLSFSKGKIYHTDEIISQIQSNPILDGITLSGGEPFSQSEACLDIAGQAHRLGLNVWCYSGYTFEELVKQSPDLLWEADVLVDGPFILSQRSMDLMYRGSKNQRVIDIKRTKQTGHIVIWEP